MQTEIEHDLLGIRRLLKRKGFDKQVNAFAPTPLSINTGIFLDFGNDCRALGTLAELGAIIEQADNIESLKSALDSEHQLER